MDKHVMTVNGSNLLREELKMLKSKDRPEIIQAIATARGFGDLKENAEYHAAREEQAKIESRVIEINDLIARANVIDVTKLENNESVIFGSTVDLIDLENNEKGFEYIKTWIEQNKDRNETVKDFIPDGVAEEVNQGATIEEDLENISHLKNYPQFL